MLVLFASKDTKQHRPLALDMVLRMNLNKEGLYFFVKRHCLGSMLLRIFHIKQDHSESSRTADWVQVEPTKRQKLFNAKSV